MIAPDMATMLAFVFTDAAIAGAGAAGAARARRTQTASTASPSTATPRPATRCCCSRPARRAHAAVARAGDPRLKRFPREARRGDASIWRSRSCATARARRNSSRSTSPARRRDDAARRIGARDRQLAAGQDRDRRRRRQLGPHRHGGRQVRRAGRSRQARDRDRRPRSPPRAARCPATTRRRWRAHMKRPGDRHRRRRRHRQRRADVWTCDLTHGYIDINGAIAAEAAC